ncbi:APC family permease [Halobaculum sp. MBLA0147]|uniref:APC family permease n=1 Tax=Halobaculum sp. MBLA0147 TaxID=3079934 RepID=UPI00352412D2
MSSHGDRSPEAELGLLDATMIGMGAMIGAGIFVLTGLAAETAGPAAILVFALNGVVTTFTGLSYAELASAIPKSGGGYAFVNEVFGDLVSFLMGWMLWFAYMIAGALYALGFAPNAVELAHVYLTGTVPPPEAVAQTTITGLALGAVILLVLLNTASTAAAGSAETVFTITKVLILVVFVFFGVTAPVFSTAEFQPLFPTGKSPVDILPAMGLTFIAFEGYDLITTVTEEVENPRENIPRAIFLSLGATVIVYLSVVGVAIGTLGAERLGSAGETGIAAAAGGFMPEFPLIGGGEALIVFGAVFSTLTALNAVVIASSRVAFSMGRDGRLLPRFGQIHHRFGTPAAAILASAVVMVLSVAFVPIRQVGNLSSLFFLLSFVVVNGSVIRLRRQRPNLNRPFEMPLYPAAPVLGIVLNLVLGVFIDPFTWGLGAVWLGLGVVTYYGLESLRDDESGGEGVPGGGGPGGDPDAEVATDGGVPERETASTRDVGAEASVDATGVDHGGDRQITGTAETVNTRDEEGGG